MRIIVGLTRATSGSVTVCGRRHVNQPNPGLEVGVLLDEPANGLDPAGIRWMRGLLRDYADGGGTVLLSLHLLHEIEVIADDLVVIGSGRIVALGAKEDLLRSAGSIVQTPDRDTVARALTASGTPPHPSATTGCWPRQIPGRPGIAACAAFAAGVPVTELRPADGAGPEEMFLELTADTQGDKTTSVHSEGAVA